MINRLISKKLEILVTICWLCTLVRIDSTKDFNNKHLDLLLVVIQRNANSISSDFVFALHVIMMNIQVLSKFDYTFCRFEFWVSYTLQLSTTRTQSLRSCTKSCQLSWRTSWAIIFANFSFWSRFELNSRKSTTIRRKSEDSESKRRLHVCFALNILNLNSLLQFQRLCFLLNSSRRFFLLNLQFVFNSTSNISTILSLTNWSSRTNVSHAMNQIIFEENVSMSTNIKSVIDTSCK